MTSQFVSRSKCLMIYWDTTQHQITSIPTAPPVVRWVPRRALVHASAIRTPHVAADIPAPSLAYMLPEESYGQTENIVLMSHFWL